jgi:lysophospholipid acyltransferase 1/2
MCQCDQLPGTSRSTIQSCMVDLAGARKLLPRQLPNSTLLNYYSTSFVFFLFQLNFVTCQVIALCLGPVYRIHLHPAKVGANIRHFVAVVVGILLGYFCFGR